MASEGPRHDIARNIAVRFETAVPGLTPDCCIYRVARCFHKLNDGAYTPRVISIGPFHHGKLEMQFMERQKERYLLQFIHRTKLSLESLVIFAKNSEESIRRCYAESIELQNEDFVEMILLDGSFVIEYFLKIYFGTRDQSDTILFKPRLTNDIISDLILLENQLPFWLLEKLYNLSPSINPKGKIIPFTKVACHYFSYFNKRKVPHQDDILHFTDLIRRFNLPSNPRKEPAHNVTRDVYFSFSATDLHAAGVKFKANDSKCLFDIQFTVNDGVLSFPHFHIEDRTETLFRNLMALEQYHYPHQMYICDYIILMDKLIDTTKDVEILVKKGIVTNRLGGDDVLVTLINNLGREIVHDSSDSYFCKLTENLKEYYEKPWHKWKSNLKQDYFSNPWKTASTIAAAILLILTFIQTVNSFYR